jgi:hypothetical protein
VYSTIHEAMKSATRGDVIILTPCDSRFTVTKSSVVLLRKPTKYRFDNHEMDWCEFKHRFL